ncbi:2-keto-4-pentenoate hydratase [Novosphingobium mangrovi (ex Huang et al. 2023)]|uniref:Fumarylacetoacetate hydrolase family protein n=1 Tax=Novosphingobium mangrovi (ex Huang et al. 2023) TaxID=2976432 RepID=A0ABT2I9B0_9SPHN|nr:fumarylacetoacetate hydrolase family protein [Novosphingobium mangrovi (ex Huang et al. 2023)]MCT2401399.1 fumarylacetoacetate hydrolase family protein [Novosphingobium mangrovi (ex Huang et al. 2023)]
MLDSATLDRITAQVATAQAAPHTMPKLTEVYPGLDVEDGYAVQDRLLARWLDEGRELIGLKAGLTSKAKMEQMGVSEPSFGILMRDTLDPEGSIIPTQCLIHPRVEAEIAFVMKDELGGPEVSIDQVLDATDFVQPAIEILDSRFEKFKFDLPSVIADNGSSARFVMGGRPRRARNVDLRTIGMVMELNGEIVAMASSGAVLGHPARSIQMLVAWLHGRGRTLPAGSIVLTGGATAAIAVKPDDAVIVRYQDMGEISVRFG